MDCFDVREFCRLSLSAVQADNGMSWSEDHKISFITSTGLHLLGFKLQGNMKSDKSFSLILLIALVLIPAGHCSNITTRVFGTVTDILPGAFGDFNSDELVDLFTVRGDNKVLEVFLASEQEPLLRPHGIICHYDSPITSVVPGDFDGDFHMDVLVTVKDSDMTKVYVSWGGGNHLNCSNDKEILKIRGQPLAFDYDHNMVVDLFGEDENGKRMIWVFNGDRKPPTTVPFLKEGKLSSKLRDPHSHAFFDVNDDFAPDLYLAVENEQSEVEYEIWVQVAEKEYSLNETVSTKSIASKEIGQSLFIDLELEGTLLHIIPACMDENCEKSTIFVYYGSRWCNLNPNFKDASGKFWGFVKPSQTKFYLNTISLRAGDFNLDGYPDLLATLKQGEIQKVFLLENVPCEVKSSCEGLSRTFKVRWDTLSSMNKGTSMGVFYDLYQDGVLDIILVNNERVQAFRNSLDYDANFVKVMVLAGREKGTSLPGPRISYKTTTQEGSKRTAVAAQLPQSAYHSLGLPYSIFGLGRTPNFVDTLTVGVGGMKREWTQIIPNSQMVVVPFPRSEPYRWRARLFVTPSKLILLSVAALTGTCCLIVMIIIGLYMKERREDRIEKLQEAHRFHFDAM